MVQQKQMCGVEQMDPNVGDDKQDQKQSYLLKMKKTVSQEQMINKEYKLIKKKIS